ncbi:hypothetical protein ACQU0X_16585 [Pseudovibrio ascidiaceicola]|uniref:hypothetical protein n=1 Tax=Pseudovibrio ascidiaceicola TaxID=285279 RepID=UPI003D3611A8
MTKLAEQPFELNLDQAEDVEWIMSQNDPALWHEAAVAALAYVGDKHGFLFWLIKQNRMDRATAAHLFFWLEGSEYLRGKISSFYAAIGDQEVVELLKKICERSETIGFEENNLGLLKSFENERQNCLTVVASGNVKSGVVVPTMLISEPFEPETESGDYFIDDGLLLNKAALLAMLEKR